MGRKLGTEKDELSLRDWREDPVMSGNRKVSFVLLMALRRLHLGCCITAGHLVPRNIQMNQRRYFGGDPTS